MVPNVHSIYRWKGRVCDDGEFLLLIKTRAKEFAGVRETILKLNTYELPEVLAYRVDEALRRPSPPGSRRRPSTRRRRLAARKRPVRKKR